MFGQEAFEYVPPNPKDSLSPPKKTSQETFKHSSINPAYPFLSHISQLIGASETKPFECVGSIDEARASLVSSIKHYNSRGKSAPNELLLLADKIDEDPDDKTREDIKDIHFLPKEYLSLLKENLS